MSDPRIVLYGLAALFLSGVIGWVSGGYLKHGRTISLGFAASVSVVAVILILPTAMLILSAGRVPEPASLLAVPIGMKFLFFFMPVWFGAILAFQLVVAIFPCVVAHSIATKHRLRDAEEQKQRLEELRERIRHSREWVQRK